ncbi:MAG: hypothetical protein ACE5R4_17320 [Armatimonadota bacterium]
MTRRQALLATLLGGAAGLQAARAMAQDEDRRPVPAGGSDTVPPELPDRFPRYTQYDPTVPVWCITPESGPAIHRFFDTSPISPSGRYVGLTKLPFDSRMSVPGDAAEILLVDLETGEQRVVAQTHGWDTQLGAQVQWGAQDTELFFNDMDLTEWRPFGVKLDPISGAGKDLDGTVYVVSPDGRYAASPCLLRTGRTQPGYGVIAPPEHVPINKGAAADDGVYVTDTSTGECRLLVSFRQILETAQPPMDPDEYSGGAFYGFHVKYNQQGTRIMLVLRWLPEEGDRKRMKRHVITMRADGSDIRVAIPDSEWSKGGHHPNWCPDGETVMMNLKMDGKTLRFVKAKYDGSDYGLMSDVVVGSGHPSLHPDGRHIVTDSYLKEPVAFGDGTTPIRLVDLRTAESKNLIRIRTEPNYSGPSNELRVDPHPAWDRSFRRIAFNACPDGTRRVYIADLTEVVG